MSYTLRLPEEPSVGSVVTLLTDGSANGMSWRREDTTPPLPGRRVKCWRLLKNPDLLVRMPLGNSRYRTWFEVWAEAMTGSYTDCELEVQEP